MAKLFFAVCFMLSLIGFFLLITFSKENYLYQIFVQVGFVSAALFFIWEGSIKETFRGLGIPGDLKRIFIWLILGAVLIFVVAVLNAVILLLLDMNDAHKVYDVMSGVPAWILVLAVIIAPVTEELFFRAALVPRIGIVLSSLLFGLFHVSYGSIAEIIGAFLIGMVLAFVYRKSKSIITPMLLHICFNLVSVVAVLIANGWL